MTKGKWILLATLILVNLFVWSAILDASDRHLTVSFLDVGQGDAIFIEAPNGNQVLIDGGPGRSVLRELGSLMSFRDRSIDVVLATHPDRDHIGGLPSVLEYYDVSFILEPGTLSESGTYEELERLASIEPNAYHVTARRGQVIDLGDGVFLRILFPDRDIDDIETNTSSVIAQLTYGDTEFLLTGDSPKSIEYYVLSLDGETLESDVLKLGHHGSDTSSAGVFVRVVDPEYSIISAGQDNSYGHPHREVLDTLAETDTKKLATYERGTITFESDGESVSLK